jgi:hypothetical protein
MANRKAIQFGLRTVLLGIAGFAVLFSLGPSPLALAAVLYIVVDLWRMKKVLPSSAAMVAVLATAFTGIGFTVQVRPDTGDERHCFWGIPFMYSSLPAPARRAIIACGTEDSPRRWTTRSTRMPLRRYYLSAAAWYAEDEEIAKLVVADLSACARTGCHDGPASWFLLDLVELDEPGGRVSARWRTERMVVEYLREKGYAWDDVARLLAHAAIEELNDDDLNNRINAAWILGMMGPAAKAAIPELTQLLNHSDARVSEIAADALSEIDGSK